MNASSLPYPVAYKWLKEFQRYEALYYKTNSAFTDCESALLSGDIDFVLQRVSKISWAGMGGFGDYMECIDRIGQEAFDKFVEAARYGE